MIPNTATALKLLARRIMSRLVPDARSTYAMSDGAMVTMLVSAMAEELESGIDKRIQDIEAMRQIFQLARAVPDPRLRQQMAELLIRDIKPLTLTSVCRIHDDCTKVLIRLHEISEAQGDSGAELSNAIWRYLELHAARHALKI